MAKTSWLEIILEVESEMAEPVAEVFSRYAPGGVVIESVVDARGDKPIQMDVYNPVRVICYLKYDEKVEDTRLKLEESLWYLSRIRPLPEPIYQQVYEEDWANAWKDHFHPIKIGRNLLVSPAWNIDNLDGRTQIIIDPGMAFGTGVHPSTQLCLELIEDLLDEQFQSKQRPPGTVAPGDYDVIDIGCGSGILAIAALKVGAGRAFCVDIDPTAVEVAKENAQINGVAERMLVSEGSLDELKALYTGFDKNRLIMANILAPVLIKLLDQGLADLVQPASFLVLSGVIADQKDQILRAADQKGLFISEKRTCGDWVALCAQKRS
jgi:ribosomal protein L11 methyltransferase